jgi:serine/threonine protein kinase
MRSLRRSGRAACEVYRARDTRFGRDVALKILPADVAGDPERQQRFETEARAVAALNHPNIVAIHDVAFEDRAAFIVSELVQGETLRAVIQRGPVALRKALAMMTVFRRSFISSSVPSRSLEIV